MTLCVTYYQDIINSKIEDIKIHKSGVKACDYLENTAKNYFNLPINKKNTYKITNKYNVRIGYPLRGFVGRQLNEREIELYKSNEEDDICMSPIDCELHTIEEGNKLIKEYKDNKK